MQRTRTPLHSAVAASPTSHSHLDRSARPASFTSFTSTFGSAITSINSARPPPEYAPAESGSSHLPAPVAAVHSEHVPPAPSSPHTSSASSSCTADPPTTAPPQPYPPGLQHPTHIRRDLALLNLLHRLKIPTRHHIQLKRKLISLQPPQRIRQMIDRIVLLRQRAMPTRIRHRQPDIRIQLLRRLNPQFTGLPFSVFNPPASAFSANPASTSSR